jgi:elongation factor 1-alpha
MHHESLAETLPGDNVVFNLKNVSVKRWSEEWLLVITRASDPPKGSEKFHTADYHYEPSHPGYSSVLDYHTTHIALKFSELKGKINHWTGKTKEANPNV